MEKLSLTTIWQEDRCRQMGGIEMARRRGIMSDDLKYEIAKELGVDDVVRTEGWGAVSSKDCGNMVKIAIEMAERNIKNQSK